MGPKDGLAALADKKREMTRSGAIVHPHPIPPRSLSGRTHKQGFLFRADHGRGTSRGPMKGST